MVKVPDTITLNSKLVNSLRTFSYVNFILNLVMSEIGECLHGNKNLLTNVT